jgi:stage V sporulation protein G
MEISDVKVFPVQEEKLKAFVSVIFDRCFMVNDIKIIQGKEGLFISMPSRRKRNGEFKDIAHPLNNETRRWLEDRVLGEYRRLLEGGDVIEPRRDAGAAPPPALRSPGSPEQAPERSDRPIERSLEEIEELHLRDSFWTV